MSRSSYVAIAGSFVAAAAMLVAGCQGSGGLARLQENLAEISEKQDTVLSRLDDIEQKVGKAGPAAPGARPKPKGPDPKATYKVAIGDAAAKGGDQAKVTLVAWSDFQCPFCSRVNPTLKTLEEQYGDKLRVVFKHNPLSFHNRAMPAALAAEAARKQGKFWELHDIMFQNQKQLTDENFAKWAGELGLDVDKFKADMKDPAIKKLVSEQQRQGMTLGARGTPAFFVNGRFLSGAQPVDAFKKLIDEEMGKADKLLAAGTPVDKLYDKVIEKGRTKI